MGGRRREGWRDVYDKGNGIWDGRFEFFLRIRPAKMGTTEDELKLVGGCTRVRPRSKSKAASKQSGAAAVEAEG